DLQLGGADDRLDVLGVDVHGALVIGKRLLGLALHALDHPQQHVQLGSVAVGAQKLEGEALGPVQIAALKQRPAASKLAVELLYAGAAGARRAAARGATPGG